MSTAVALRFELVHYLGLLEKKNNREKAAIIRRKIARIDSCIKLVPPLMPPTAMGKSF
jgi:hypothetical protein